MISLKSFLPTLSNYTALSVTALYERQRSLVRIGLFPAPKQSGRNSGGALASPRNVAIMLMSVLATDRLSEMDGRVAELLTLKPIQNFEYATVLDCLEAILDGRTAFSAAVVAVDRRRQLVHFSDANPAGALPIQFGDTEIFAPIDHLVTFRLLFELSLEIDTLKHPAHADANREFTSEVHRVGAK